MIVKEKMKDLEAWELVATDLYVGDSEYDSYVDTIVAKMRELGYELSIKSYETIRN